VKGALLTVRGKEESLLVEKKKGEDQGGIEGSPRVRVIAGDFMRLKYLQDEKEEEKGEYNIRENRRQLGGIVRIAAIFARLQKREPSRRKGKRGDAALGKK